MIIILDHGLQTSSVLSDIRPTIFAMIIFHVLLFDGSRTKGVHEMPSSVSSAIYMWYQPTIL